MISKNKVCLLLLALLLLPIHMIAVPALSSVAKTIKVGNTEYAVTLRGDEFCHYWQAETGEKIVKKADGSYHILSYFESENLIQQASESRNTANSRRIRKQEELRQPLTGTKKGLVILVNFRDNEFSISDPNSTYNDIFNQLDYTGYGMTGSVRDYFLAQSYGLFDMTLDVAGPYTLTKPMSAYGGNDENGQDKGVLAFAKESFMLADPDVNYADYDWDGDGTVEQVFIVYAGYAEAQGGAANTIWPHSYGLSEPLLADGVKVSQYACSSELRGSKGEDIDGIGTVCHEFSHCLGLMDHYDTQGNNFGTGYWDLMAAGSYNNNSCTPAAYTSFERWTLGWLDPIVLDEQTDVVGMKSLVDSPEAYIMYNDANPNEFYMLENRQLKGFDSALYGHGLLVLHVDYDIQAWQSNTVNVSAGHQRMTIIPADGEKVASQKSLKGDPFPGLLGVTALTDHSTPSAVLYNKNVSGEKLMSKPIEDIYEDENGLITFKALYPMLTAPEPTATILDASSFKLTWPAVPYADKYELELTEYSGKKSPEEARIIEEDFEGAYKSTNGFSDIGSKLNNYLSTPGFSGTSLFQTPDKLRFGSSTTKGTLKSPTLGVLSTARFTLVLKVKPFTEGTKVSGMVNVVTQVSNAMNIPFEFTKEGYLLLYPTENIETLFYFNIKPDSRMYMSYLALYDGVFTAEELGLEAAARVDSHKPITYSTSEPEYTFQGLNPSSRYEIVMRSVNGTRYSPWSEPYTVSFAATGITDIEKKKDNAVLYDIQGRKVLYPIRGNVYIQNGRKIVY